MRNYPDVIIINIVVTVSDLPSIGYCILFLIGSKQNLFQHAIELFFNQ